MFSVSGREETQLLYRVRSTEYNLIQWYFREATSAGVRRKNNVKWSKRPNVLVAINYPMKTTVLLSCV